MKKTAFILTGLCLGATAIPLFGQSIAGKADIIVLNRHPAAGIRAMSVVSDTVIWVGGSRGYVGKTTDGGKNWQWMRPGDSTLDFRSLRAFDGQKAVVANAGSPASIFLTADGGANWKKVYTNPDSAIFLDGMVFKNGKEGLVYGDPVQGHFVILKTKDGGLHWKRQPLRRRPRADAGEASFAASNSAVFTIAGTGRVWIGSGGTNARVFFSRDFGKRWEATPVPVLRGKSSTGIFSLAFFNKDTGICVGGDYRADTVRLNNAALTTDGGKTWQKPLINPYGYRSCVAYLSRDTLLATGTSGTDFSKDGGLTWHRVSPEGYNVIGISPRDRGKVYLAGANGEVARLLFSSDNGPRKAPLPEEKE